MLTNCEVAAAGVLELTEPAFFYDAAELLVLVVPAAILCILWRIFVTNRSGPRGGVVVLGLDDSSSIYSDLDPKGVSIYFRLLYCLVSLLTFLLGLIAFEGVLFLSKEYYFYW